MNDLASRRIAELRQKFAAFEHGGQCFGSEEITGIVRELADIGRAVAALERKPDGRRSAPPPPPPARKPGAIEIGTFFFVPNAAVAERH